VVSKGARARRGILVVHLACREGDPGAVAAPRIGLAVGRGVGGSVERHKVSRRLREASRILVSDLPCRVDMVIRALPGAADVDFITLSNDLQAAVEGARIKAGV
jgi:ribonuclease P protein component